MADDGRQQIVETPARGRVEVVGEIILLAIVGSFFVYMFVKSLGWPLGAALMPRIVVIIGFPFLIVRLVSLLRRTTKAQSMIMDMGFRIGEDSKSERRRFVRISLFIVGLYLGIWMFGFHIALPLGMLYYLRVHGKVSWTTALAIAFVFLAAIVGVYDHLLHATWHEPLALTLWNHLSG